MKGYVKLHRKIIESSVFDNPNLLKMFIWALAKASYKARKTMVGLTEVELDAGQFITGRKVASAELGFSESSTQKYFKTLEKMGVVTLKTTKKYTIITVVNWTTYQEENAESVSTDNSEENLDNQEVEVETVSSEYQPSNNGVTSEEQQSNNTVSSEYHKQEIKNIEKLKKEKKERTHTQLDPRVESVKCVFEQRYGLLNYSVVEDITMLINSGMQEDVIIKALSLANKGYSANYALKICKNWLSDGVRTMQDYEVKEGVNYGNDSRNARNNAVTKDDELPPIQKSEAELRYEAYELTDYVEEDLPF